MTPAAVPPRPSGTWSQDDLIPHLIAAGELTEAAVAGALARQAEARETRSLVYHLVETGDLRPAALLAEAQRRFPGIETVDLAARPPRADAATLLPRDLAHRLHVLPLARTGNVLHVAVADPYAIEVIEHLQLETGNDVRPFMADDYHLTRALLAVHPQGDSVDSLLGDAARERAGAPGHVSESDAIERVVAAAKVPQAVMRILRDGVRMGASDIHIEWSDTSGRVRYRRDGHLMSRSETLPIEVRSQLVNRIKILASMNTAQDRVPDNGHLEVAFDEGGPRVHFRVSTLPTVTGEKVVLRIMEHDEVRRTLEDLGLEPDQREILRDAARCRDRMVLVTGPTGSGKTTTLYAVLEDTAGATVNIVTIEDPVERRLAWVNQVSIQGRPDESDTTRLTFAGVLMNVLRQDPDVILVGEIRDLTTAQTAVRAAITGHRVMSSLHTPDAVATVARLRDMGLEPYAIAEAIELILSQRLVRCICASCTEPAPALTELQVAQAKVDPAWAARIRPSRGRGCPDCAGTGYRGRRAVHELFLVGPEVRRAIAAGAEPDQLRRAAREAGLVTLREAGMRLVERGLTTLDEVLTETPDPE